MNALGHVNHSKAGASQWKQASCGTNALLGKDRGNNHVAWISDTIEPYEIGGGGGGGVDVYIICVYNNMSIYLETRIGCFAMQSLHAQRWVDCCDWEEVIQ